MTTITITLPLPPKATHPNARPHWAAKAAAVKKQRWEAGIAALAALAGRPPPRWKAAKCQATFYVAKLGDADGRLASLKGAIDSLQDAGIIENDAGLVHLPVQQVVCPKHSGERKVVLVIEGV